jgi:hypothetical protein
MLATKKARNSGPFYYPVIPLQNQGNALSPSVPGSHTKWDSDLIFQL